MAATSEQTRADDTIKHPGDHPKYPIEAEVHASLGWTRYFNAAADDGFGLGARFSIPIVDNGFVSSINDSVAISFGIDWLHYSGVGCWYYYGRPPPPPGPPYPAVPCYYAGDANYLLFPVALQWNFFVARQWSVFAELGLHVYHGFFDYCSGAPPGFPCANPSSTGVDPVVAIGGRYHFNENVALVLRLGYPTVSFGVSLM